jgi:probable HAF family extracellular repeat protein
MELVAGRSRLLASALLAAAATMLACSAATDDPVAGTGGADVHDDGGKGGAPEIAVRSLGAGWALGVNEAGQIAGATFSPAGDGTATLWNPDGSVTSLFAQKPGGSSHAFDVSDLGAAAGVVSGYGSVYPFSAYRWTASGGVVGLDAPSGAMSRARSVNAAGQAVGDVEGGLAGATLWEADGTRVELGTLGGPLSGADEINDAGQVAGWSHTPAGVTHAFRWTPASGMEDLGTLGGGWSGARGLNALGHVAGWSQTSDGATHAFLWTPEAGMVDLDPSGSECYAEAVNDRDEVVGYHYPEGSARAFFWSSGTGLIELGTLGGGFSRAWDLNESGVVVGDSTDGIAPELATVWTVTLAR